jgi:hypothetical protein
MTIPPRAVHITAEALKTIDDTIVEDTTRFSGVEIQLRPTTDCQENNSTLIFVAVACWPKLKLHAAEAGGVFSLDPMEALENVACL